MAIQLKRSLASNIDSSYVLAQGQLGIEMPGTTNTDIQPFKFKIGDGNSNWSTLPYFGNQFVETSRTINGHALTADVNLSASDVGALPSTWRPSTSDMTDFVPSSRTINNKALTSDITLTASDVGAADSNHSHSNYLSSSGTAASATKLATARTIRTNLASTSTASFNGTSNVTPGVTGVLPVANGGTGVTTLADLKTAIGSGSVVSVSGSSSGRPYYSFSTDGVNPTVTQFTFLNAQSYSKDTAYSTSLENTYDNAGVSNQNTGRVWMQFTANASKGLNYPQNKTTVSIFAGPKNAGFAGWAKAEYNDVELELGNADAKWKAVYATTGTIQTSDRSAKTNIQYLDDADVTIVSEENPENVGCTTADVLSFVQQFRPASFEYNHADEECPSENLQLGMIADDLAELPIYKYIGTYHEWDAEAAQLDNDGNVVREARPAGHSRGLQAIPLATCALVACKYLMQRVELLEEQISKS